MNNVFLSIVTICRNECNSIRKTFESVLCQTFRDFEYIVIDGGSTDGTTEIIQTYSDSISYWISEPDNGIYHAMNKGILQARGEYLLFLNAGDCLCDALVLDRVFSTQPVLDIIYGDIFKAATDGSLRFCSVEHYKCSPWFLFSHTLYHQASFIKRRLFQHSGLYDESYRISGDLEFFMRALIRDRASAGYLGFPISNFKDNGISSATEHKRKKRHEDARARRSSYGDLRYYLFFVFNCFYENAIYRPVRKIRHFMGKS